jgi:hypothetical protein
VIIELTDDGYEKIMDEIQRIEDIACEGIFPRQAADELKDAHKKFQSILSEVKNLRQVLLENLVIVPMKNGPDEPSAA